MNNINYDLVKEALLKLAQDRYSMPNNIDDMKERISLIHETYHLIEEEQMKNQLA